MKVTYFGHSGFGVETESAVYIFDYIKGEIPDEYDVANKASGKPVYVFVSHAHSDHFSGKIFDLEGRFERVEFVLSDDIAENVEYTEILQKSAKTCKITYVKPHEICNFGSLKVETFESNDEGVAFALTEPSGTIYHAGDLNWWDWFDESADWNADHEERFKREIALLEGRSFDLAFAPLDPRLKDKYWLGLQYLLEHVAVKRVYPMHFWKEPEIIDKYLKEHGADPKKINTIIEKDFA